MRTPAPPQDLIEVAARLRTAVTLLTRQTRQQGTEPLTATQSSVLGSIHRHPNITLGDLASRERLSPPMITRVITALEEHALVERHPDTVDRRVCRVSVSEEGRRWIEEGRARRNALLAEQLAELDPEDLRILDAATPVLQRLVDDDI